MIKEAKTVAIASMILLLFALMTLFSQGGLVFPFPLNETIFFVVATRFLLWHPKKKAVPYLFFVSSIFAVLGAEFFWEIFMSAERLYEFYQYPVTDWSRLLSLVFLVWASIYFLRSAKIWYAVTLLTLGVATYVFGMVINTIHLQIIGLGIIVGSNILRPVLPPFHLIWVLLFVLKGTEWFTKTFI